MIFFSQNPGGGYPDLNVGWVSAQHGSDTAGDGTQGKPYSTAQKAYDAGYRTIAAYGNVGNIIGTELNLTLIGFGASVSIFGNIQSTSGGGFVQGNGRANVYVGAITVIGTAGANGAAGTGLGNPGEDGSSGGVANCPRIEALSAGSITIRGGTG
ncbi:MAG TPA: hypothetical protein VD994_20325, partial [Prosthecobacter sp.]|nr:hypothetical protein [Prosthecobacter sp.]